MLVALLLIVIGGIWLLHLLVKDHLQITLPKLTWQRNSVETVSKTVSPMQATLPETADLLGPAKGLNGRSSAFANQLPPEIPDHSDETLVDNGDNQFDQNSSSEVTYFSLDNDTDGTEETDDEAQHEHEQSSPDEDTILGESTIVQTFSNQLLDYPEGESQTQPETFDIPITELDEGGSELEAEEVSLDELANQDTSTDVPLDKYFDQLLTVESILFDIQKQVRRNRNRQTVDELCRQFTEVVGYYGMINDKNVMNRVANVLEPIETVDYASQFIRLQRECMGQDEDEIDQAHSENQLVDAYA